MAGMESEQMTNINDNLEVVAGQYQRDLAVGLAEIKAMQKIPASIVKAIVAVMLEVGIAEKDAENKHSGYKYASIDSVYECVHAAMAKAGLVIIPMEEKVERVGEKFLGFTFGFVFATEQDTWEDPRNQRSVMVSYTGPQTYQTAQSYCEKALLKGVFKLQTSDEPEETEGGEGDAKSKKPTKKAPAKMDEAQAATFLGLVKGRIRNSKDMGELARVVDEHGGTVASLDEKFRAEVRAAYKAQETILTKSNGSA
jgi:hypothetical protein